MKRYFLLILLCTFSIFVSAQSLSTSAVPLVNALNKSWDDGDVGRAVPLSIELYRISPETFVNMVHLSFAKKIDNEKAGLSALSYLKLLMSQKDKGINEIVAPLYHWGMIKYSKDPKAIRKNFTALKDQLVESSYGTNRTERYCLFSLSELRGREVPESQEQLSLLRQLIEKLERRHEEIEEDLAKAKGSMRERAWARYLLAYSYHSLYKNHDADPEFLKKSSYYSSDQDDLMESTAYIYDADILTRKKSSLGFKIDYFSYLQENSLHKEALEEITAITFLNPSDTNLNLLRSFYEDHAEGQSFNDYWQAYVHKQGEPVPKVKLRFSKYDRLDLNTAPGVWVYIDFWGTWCPPCIEELPKVQDFYLENIRRGGVPKLKVYTLSFMSKNLSGFMKDRGYVFPVSEVDKELTDDFMVASFPTKVLISPEGNFIRIPHGVDWQTYVKNYALL